MKIFGKKKRKARRKDPKHIRVMRVMLWRFLKRIRLRERVDMANRWASLHMGRTASITVALLSLSLLAGILTMLLDGNEEKDPCFDSIAIISPIFSGMRYIQQNKAYQESQVEKMTISGKEIKRELDSLVHIPLKSHDDSVQIVIKYKQLEMIVNNLENSR